MRPTLLLLLAPRVLATTGPTASPRIVTVAAADVPIDGTVRAAAAQTFLATLSVAQRKAVLFRFDDIAQRQHWSNFPSGFVPRLGVKWGDLDEGQRAALLALLGTILSPEGVGMVREQMAADDVLRTRLGGPRPGGVRGPHVRGERGPPPGGFPGGPPSGGFSGGPPPGAGPPGGGRGFPFGVGGSGGSGGPDGPGGPRGAADFGSALYYVSILGTPSPTGPWIFQFGGHHLAINATMANARVTLSPSLTGGEPLRFDQEGRRVYIVEREVTAASALLASLAPDQRAKAVVSSQHIDLVLGPGHDGKVLQPEALAGAAMSPGQRRLLLALVEARLGIQEATTRAPVMAAVRADLDRTYFAWFGPAAPLGAAYFRVTGPMVLIEYAPQDMDGDATNHAHNMYRDPTNEYGAKWTAVR